jgi:Protein of unknown function (DUF1236)
MKAQLCSGFAAIALVASVSAAAAGPGTMMKSGQQPLTLTTTQQNEIYQDVSQQKVSQTAPKSFTARVGETVPGSIKLSALPASATKQVPAVKSYDYAMLGKQLIIVDPSTKKVSDVITQ